MDDLVQFQTFKSQKWTIITIRGQTLLCLFHSIWTSNSIVYVIIPPSKVIRPNLITYLEHTRVFERRACVVNLRMDSKNTCAYQSNIGLCAQNWCSKLHPLPISICCGSAYVHQHLQSFDAYWCLLFPTSHSGWTPCNMLVYVLSMHVTKCLWLNLFTIGHYI